MQAAAHCLTQAAEHGGPVSFARIGVMQALLDGYREGGCVSCQWSDLELTRMGNRSALAAVSWTLLRQEGSSLAAWRQSYCLAPSLGGPKIFASAMHAE